jgi:hypothetical protein
MIYEESSIDIFILDCSHKKTSVPSSSSIKMLNFVLTACDLCCEQSFTNKAFSTDKMRTGMIEIALE